MLLMCTLLLVSYIADLFLCYVFKHCMEAPWVIWNVWIGNGAAAEDVEERAVAQFFYKCIFI